MGTLPGVAAHRTVNHNLEFVAADGTHKQHVESYWNRVKGKLKRMKGCRAHQLPSYLDEFMWRECNGCQTSMDYVNIMRDIATQYPV